MTDRTLNSVFTDIGLINYINKYNIISYVCRINTYVYIIYNIYDSSKNVRLYLKFENDKIEILNSKLIENKINNYSNPISHAFSILDVFCKVKIKDPTLSIKDFKYRKIKEKMFNSNKNFKIDNILPYNINKETGLDTGPVVTLITDDGGKALKFHLSDLSFTFINLDKFFKGYNAPKDRNFYIGSEFIITNNKLNKKIPHKSKGVVIANTEVNYGKLKYSTIKVDGKLYNVVLKKKHFKKISDVNEIKKEKSIIKKQYKYTLSNNIA